MSLIKRFPENSGKNWMMASINMWMTIVALLALPLSMIPAAIVGKHSRKYFQEQRENLSEMNARIEEDFSGYHVMVMQMISNIGYVIVALLGAYFVAKGEVEIGDVQSFL